MQTTIDAAGRIVIPKALRAQIGMVPGPVRVDVDGACIRIEPIAEGGLVERDGLWVIPASGEPLTDDAVRLLLEEGRG